ncbi:hypothetical protein NH340_JMT02876 [Sarcoptes scabiei]|nr:hypothetical protein NH340_JMT02876 [Sarcoptes scabiei]
MKILSFFIRLIIVYIGFSLWVFGCCLLVYVVWSLNSVNIQSIATGESLITSTQLVFGSLSSLIGLIGIYGSFRKHSSLLKVLVFLIVLMISLEIGTFVALKAGNVKIIDLVEQGWKEINNQSKNYIQKELKCCGLSGLSEFASKLDPIDESCYRKKFDPNTGEIIDKQPFRIGCKQKLIDWFQTKSKAFLIWSCLFISFQIFYLVMILILLKLLQNAIRSKLNLKDDVLNVLEHQQSTSLSLPLSSTSTIATTATNVTGSGPSL